MLLISSHRHYPFPWIVPHTRLPQLVIFSCLKLDCPAEEVVKTHTGNLHILIVSIPVSYVSTLTFPISSSVYGIISRCPIDQIRVASDSAIDTSRFWSTLLKLFWYNNSDNRLGCSKIIGLKWDRTHAKIFTRFLHFFLVFSQWEHRCSLIFTTMQISSQLFSLNDVLNY